MSNANPFQKATKRQARLRMGLMGPSNSGKTWVALTTATALGRTAVIDSEHGSASKYADIFSFDCIDITNHHPDNYVDMIDAAEAAGYECLVIDSLTHAWDATKALVDAETIRTKGNSFQIWGKVGQHYNKLMARIVASKLHIIATMRSKTEYVLEENERGKKVPRKIGLAPQVRDGAEYEFDVVLELDHEHNVWTSKTRCPSLDGKTWNKPREEIADALREWLSDGAQAIKQADNGNPTEAADVVVSPHAHESAQSSAKLTTTETSKVLDGKATKVTDESAAANLCNQRYVDVKAMSQQWATIAWKATCNKSHIQRLKNLDAVRDNIDRIIKLLGQSGWEDIDHIASEASQDPVTSAACDAAIAKLSAYNPQPSQV